MKLDSRIYVSGHNGLVGSAIVKSLVDSGYTNVITFDRNDVDLADIQQTQWMFSVYEPEYVFLSAAKVGGIGHNISNPADFLLENLNIQNNVIEASHKYKVKKLLFLGSSCIYPKNSNQPIKEDALMTGHPEPTNEGYAIAKIAGIKLCQMYKKQHEDDFISAMPCNVYGPNDKFDVERSHVIPSMIKKFHNAKMSRINNVTLFGDGSAMREFIYSYDLSDALIFLMNNYNDYDHINVGSEYEVSIKDLANLVCRAVEYDGEILWDTTKPNGMMRKKVDTSKMDNLGWTAKTDLLTGIKTTYDWYLNNVV